MKIPAKPQNLALTAIRIEADVLKRIDKIAKASKASRSEVIRLLIDKGFRAA